MLGVHSGLRTVVLNSPDLISKRARPLAQVVLAGTILLLGVTALFAVGTAGALVAEPIDRGRRRL